MRTKTVCDKDIRIDPVTGIFRVDGIIIAKRLVQDGKVILQFKDGDRIRSTCRQTMYVEICLEDFVKALQDHKVPVNPFAHPDILRRGW